MVREVGAIGLRRLDDLDDLFPGGIVGWLIVETRRDTPRPTIEVGRDDLPHSPQLLGRRTPVGFADDARPGTVEADIGADVDRQPTTRPLCELLVEIGTAAAVGVQQFGRDPLRQHVLCSRECSRRRMAVEVDEPWSHIEPGGIDFALGGLTRQIADTEDVAPGDRDVGLDRFSAGSVDHRPVPDDQIERFTPGRLPRPGWLRRSRLDRQGDHYRRHRHHPHHVATPDAAWPLARIGGTDRTCSATRKWSLTRRSFHGDCDSRSSHDLRLGRARNVGSVS